MYYIISTTPNLLFDRINCTHTSTPVISYKLNNTDLDSYREASVEVIEVMSRYAVIERASIDEAYMDLTAVIQQRLKNMAEKQIDPNQLKTTYIQGYPHQEASAEDIVLDKGKLYCTEK